MVLCPCKANDFHKPFGQRAAEGNAVAPSQTNARRPTASSKRLKSAGLRRTSASRDGEPCRYGKGSMREPYRYFTGMLEARKAFRAKLPQCASRFGTATGGGAFSLCACWPCSSLRSSAFGPELAFGSSRNPAMCCPSLASLTSLVLILHSIGDQYDGRIFVYRLESSLASRSPGNARQIACALLLYVRRQRYWCALA